MKHKAVYGICILLYILYLLFVSQYKLETYDDMDVDERIRTEQSIIPGW